MQRLLHDILTVIQSMRDRAPGETSLRLGKHPKQSHESIRPLCNCTTVCSGLGLACHQHDCQKYVLLEGGVLTKFKRRIN